MNTKNLFMGPEFPINKADRTAGFSIRLFGLDIDLCFYGYIDDWLIPFAVMPSLRGIFVQLVCVSLFIGRIEVPAAVYNRYEEEDDE